MSIFAPGYEMADAPILGKQGHDGSVFLALDQANG